MKNSKPCRIIMGGAVHGEIRGGVFYTSEALLEKLRGLSPPKQAAAPVLDGIPVQRAPWLPMPAVDGGTVCPAHDPPGE